MVAEHPDSDLMGAMMLTIGGLRAKEARAVEYRRTFLEAAGKYLWLKVFLIIVIMVASWFMVFEVNHTFGFPLLEDRMVMKREAEPKNESMENASRHERSVAPVEEVPTGKSQEGDHVEMFTTWSQLHDTEYYVAKQQCVNFHKNNSNKDYCYRKQAYRPPDRHEIEIDYFGAVLRVTEAEEFEMFSDDESDFHERIEVILDSGADVSLDAQGKKIKTEGRRMLNLTFFDQEGMCLTDGSSKIPVHLHKNSLAGYAYVQTPSKLQGQNVDYSMIRTVVQLNKHLQEAVDKDEPGWHNTDSMVIVKHGNQENFENPSLMFREEHFPYRSTLVKEDGGWRAIEVSKKYRHRKFPFEAFGEGEKEVVTAISSKPIPLWILGTPLDAQECADQESHGRDYWRIDADKGELVRYHMVPRTVLFNPTGVSGCPVLLGDLEDERQTYGECIYSTELYEHEDNWRYLKKVFFMKALVHFSTQLGYNSMVLKADNENAAKAVKDKVQKIRSPPDVDPALLQKLDEAAIEKEIRSITKLVPILALANNWAIYSVDVKDAFLQENFERSKGIPSLYRLLQENEEGEKKVVAICIVHVDDLQFAGRVGTIEPILAQLKRKVTLQVEGPFLKEDEYQRGYSEVSVRFLKRKYIFENFELKIYSDNKYSKKLVDILNLQKKKTKNSPCTPACQEKDDSPELDEESSSQYRTCVGILLYVAHDRPDIQFAVRNLSTAMSRPTTRKQKELEHLALYLKGTSDYSITYKKQSAGTSVLQKHATADEEDDEAPKVQQEHLLEVFSDSDWAGDKQTRKSVSCATFYINGAFFYSYSRTQKSIALSSAEAEYMALTGYCGCKQQFEKEEYQYMQRFQSQRQLKHSQQVVLVVLVLVIVVMASVAVNFYVTENRNKKNKKRKNQKVNSDVDLSEYQAKKEELEEAKAKHKERLEKSKKFEEEEKKFKEKEKLFEEKEKKAQKEEEKVRKLEEAVKERSLDLDVKTKGVENRLKEAEKLERKAEERMSGLTVLLQPLP
ncbi:RE1 [Symbiodinium sp. KB8]|nr:RE1 [Symbiodinium sp. KB8]